MARPRVAALLLGVALAAAAAAAVLVASAGDPGERRGESDAATTALAHRPISQAELRRLSARGIAAVVGRASPARVLPGSPKGVPAAAVRRATPAPRRFRKPAPGARSSVRRELDPADGAAGVVTLLEAGGLAIRGYCQQSSAAPGAFAQIQAKGTAIRYYGLSQGGRVPTTVTGTLGPDFTRLIETGGAGGPGPVRISATLLFDGSPVYYLDATATAGENGHDCAFAFEGTAL